MRRVVLVTVALAALLAVACTQRAPSPVASSVPTIPPDVVLPPLVIADGADVFRFAERELKKIGSVEGEARRAVGAEAGAIFVQREFGTEEKPRSDLVKIGSGGVEKVETADASQVHLYEYVDDETLLFATENPDDDAEIKGHVWLGANRVMEAFGPEFFTSSASYASDVAVVSVLCDLSECIGFFTIGGDRIEDRASPTDDLEYNAQPLVTSAVFGPGAKTLAYLEGPDVAGDSPQEPVGDWDLVVTDQPKGKELFRRRIGAKDLNVSWMDYDGRWAIISTQAGKILAVDTSASEPEVLEIPGVEGLATIAEP